MTRAPSWMPVTNTAPGTARVTMFISLMVFVSMAPARAAGSLQPISGASWTSLDHSSSSRAEYQPDWQSQTFHDAWAQSPNIIDPGYAGLEPLEFPAFHCPSLCECDFVGVGSLGPNVRCERGGMTNELMHDLYHRSPPNLTSLIISNDLNKSKRNSFQMSLDLRNLKQLKTLKMTHGSIQDLSEGLLSHLTEVEFLDFSDNLIAHISSFTFRKVSKLKILRLGQNRIQGIPIFALQDLASLEELWLEDNSIGFFAKAFSGLGNLKKLSLAGNPVKSTRIDSRDLAPMKNLEYLDLSRCQLRTLDNNFFDEVTKLKTVILSYNYLTDLPYALLAIGRTSKSLRSLDMSYNLLSEPFARHTFQQWRLAELNLAGNQLKKENILDEFSLYPSKIEKLNISCTGYRWRDVAIFRRIANQLTLFDISGNGLRTFDTQELYAFSQLSELHMRSNNISHLPTAFSRNFSNMEMLNLAKNSLKQIPQSFISGFPDLKTLDVSDNQLSAVHSLDVFAKVCSVYLHGNDWSCGCDTRIIRDFLRNRNLTSAPQCANARYDLVECATPKKYSGAKILSFDDATIPICSPIFGAVGLSYSSEIGILIGAGVAVLLIVFLTLAVVCSYAWPRLAKRKSRERSIDRMAVHFSDSKSDMGEFYGFTSRSYQRAFLENNVMSLFDDERIC